MEVHADLDRMRAELSDDALLARDPIAPFMQMRGWSASERRRSRVVANPAGWALAKGGPFGGETGEDSTGRYGDLHALLGGFSMPLDAMLQAVAPEVDEGCVDPATTVGGE